MARNTDYGEVILKLGKDYEEFVRPTDGGEILPSIEGLALYIDVARSTIYEWIKDKEKHEFSDIVERILEKQAMSLINNGLTGKFTPTITKVLLTKHGYREGQEITGKDGEQLNLGVVILPQKNGTEDTLATTSETESSLI